MPNAKLREKVPGDNHRCGQCFIPCDEAQLQTQKPKITVAETRQVYFYHLKEAWTLAFPAHVISKVGLLGTKMCPSSCCGSVLPPHVAARPSLHVCLLPGFWGGFQRLPMPFLLILTARKSGKCISHSGDSVSTQKLGELSLKKTGGADVSVIL